MGDVKRLVDLPGSGTQPSNGGASTLPATAPAEEAKGVRGQTSPSPEPPQTDLPGGGPRRAGNMLVPLLSVLVALAVLVAGVAGFLGMQEREKREAKEHELQQAVLENEDLQGRLKGLQDAKARIEGEAVRIRQELASAKEEAVKAKEAQTTLSKSVEDREREIDRLKKDLAQARNDAKEISSKLTQLQGDRDTIEQQLAEAQKAKGELESKVTELSETRPTVELEKVMVQDDGSRGRRSAASGAPAAPLDGQVVVVNREYDFIVMNLGKNHGLSAGQEFQVIRDDKVLGKVKVEKVYDELSAAAILPESQKDNIKEGDLVKAL